MIEFKITMPEMPRVNHQAIEKAARSALSRSLRGMVQDARRKAAERYRFGSKFVGAAVKVKSSGLNGKMTVSGSRNPLERFKINPTVRLNPAPAGGVYASVVKGQGGSIRRAFIQKNGGVYERLSRERFPIRRLKGVSAPQMVKYLPISNYIIEKAAERFTKNFSRAASFFGG